MVEHLGSMVHEAGAWEGLEELREVLRAFLIRQCQDENDMEDVIQETLLRAARYRRHHRVRSLRPWAMRIALNVLADNRRRVARAQSQAEGDEPFDPPARELETPADSAYRLGGLWFDGEAAEELLQHTLIRMRSQDRVLLDSYYGGGNRTQASAEACGIPQPLVKVRLYRARQRLVLALRREVALDRRWVSLAS